LYSLAQNVPGTPAFATFPVMTSAFSAAGATITINPDGTIHYDGSGSAALQATWAGETFTDTFSYTIRMADGALSTAMVTMNIAGVTDPDHDQSGFQAPADLTGDHGLFTFNASTGVWDYSLTNSDPAVQALNTGDTLTDTLAVLSTDGTSHNIVVTIHGEDDVLPPAGGGDGGDGVNGRHMINYGLVANGTVVDGVYIINGFDGDDFLQYSQNLSHGAPVAYDSDNNSTLDSTSVIFSYDNPEVGTIQVLLIGYTGVVAFAHESV
jgi:VCBS repeat-containing protein